MKKTYILEDLCCANCASKIEDAIKKLDGVTDACVTFLTGKLTVETEADDQTSIMKAVKKIITKIEPDCTIIL